MVVVGVLTRGFSPAMALPVNEKDPRGDDVCVSCVIFRNRNAGPRLVDNNGPRRDTVVTMRRGGVLARDFSPEGAFPVNENVPRGDDVIFSSKIRVDPWQLFFW